MSIFNPQKSVKKWTLGGIQLSNQLTDQSIQSFEPYAQGGRQAYDLTLGALGLGGQGGRDAAVQAFQTSPGYDFQLDQGLQAIDRSAAARGNLASGATLKALQGYGQNLANQEYGTWLGNLGKLSSAGMGALGTQAQLREAQGNRIFSGYGNIGQAQAQQSAGYLGALGQLAGSALSAISGGAGGAGGFGSLAKLFGGGGGGFGINQPGGSSTGYLY